MKYFTNYKPVGVIYGEQSMIKDIVTLGQDPIANLPASFTICSSLYLGTINGPLNIFNMWQENGKHFFNFVIYISDALRNANKSERIQMYYQTGKEKVL